MGTPRPWILVAECVVYAQRSFVVVVLDVVEVVERNWSGVSVKDMQIGMFLLDVTQGALKHKVRAPHGYTMFFKALLTTEGLAKALIPETDPLQVARPFVEKVVAERFSEKRFREDLFYNLVTLSSLARRLPTTLSQLMDDLDRQQFRLQVDQTIDPISIAARDRRHNRLILAIFAVTAAVCGSITLSWEFLPFMGIPLLSWVFYLTGLPLFLMTLWMAIRNRG